MLIAKKGQFWLCGGVINAGENGDLLCEGYDEHMMTAIEGAAEFYKFTAAKLPLKKSCTILDLGCGTGIELESYLTLNPSADIWGIDIYRRKCWLYLKVNSPTKICI